MKLFSIAILVFLIYIKTTVTATMEISSSAFENQKLIPMKYTCEGENVNPPLEIKSIPFATKSLALIVEDPDATNGTFDHWIQYNITPDHHSIAENSLAGISGKNGTGNTGYHGPCPPSGTHRYFFKVYALDILIDAKEGIDKQTLQKAMKNHILANGEIVGLYKKNEIAK